jgi:hypothetical protein
MLGERVRVRGVKRTASALSSKPGVVPQEVGIAAKKLEGETRRVERAQFLICARRLPVGASHRRSLL